LALVYLGMGSNLGFRLAHLRDGLRELREAGVPLAVSDVIETPPFGPRDQPPYLNLVATLQAEWSPLTLLRAVKAIERRVGRRPTYRWGPRVLDIDLLLYDDLRLETPLLTLPHPRVAERDFVMRPLRQIAPEVAEAFSRQ
jgi:2-amino-4-hydroxy-6-hydroxymethyldihydropteridine diphosphokinase